MRWTIATAIRFCNNPQHLFWGVILSVWFLWCANWYVGHSAAETPEAPSPYTVEVDPMVYPYVHAYATRMQERHEQRNPL